MKKRKLEAEFDYDFSLFGMITALKEYKLAWLINTSLNVQLDKAKDIEIDFLKSDNLIISNYLFQTEHSYLRLLRNKSMDQFDENSIYLMPELKRFDYFMLVSGFEDSLSNEVLKEKISLIPKVQYVQIFAVDSLKSKENLIF